MRTRICLLLAKETIKGSAARKHEDNQLSFDQLHTWVLIALVKALNGGRIAVTGGAGVPKSGMFLFFDQKVVC